MSQIWNSEGRNELQGSWIRLGVAVVVAALVGGASHWYFEKERRDSVAMTRRVQDARARLDGARRERDSLVESAAEFRTLVDRGLLQGERRLELVELVNELRGRYQLFALDYDISPQRPLTLASGQAFGAIDVLGSRVRLRLRALHEGDALGFVSALGQTPQGFYPVDTCTMRRVQATADLQPHVEAECSLEWITLQEKKRG
ncbi:MAG TPA: hypothetical protein VFE23_18910 [Usitatibacter sp.]|jgi:hypothetical protein|nr:hypothetical protein [Usitatibacter sp.]